MPGTIVPSMDAAIRYLDDLHGAGGSAVNITSMAIAMREAEAEAGRKQLVHGLLDAAGSHAIRWSAGSTRHAALNEGGGQQGLTAGEAVSVKAAGLGILSIETGHGNLSLVDTAVQRLVEVV